MDETGNIISLYNRQAILNISQGIMTQAGVLAWSIPVLSYKVIAGMQGFAEGLSGVAHSGAFTASQVVSEVASGNLSYGNGSFKNISWGNENFNNTQGNKHDTNETHFEGMRKTQDSSGVITTETGSGITYDTTSNRSNTGVVGNFSESLTNNLQRQVAETKTNTENKLLARNESMTDFDKSFSKLTGETVKSGWDAKGSVEVKTSAGLKIFGNGATAEGVVSYAVNGGVSNDVAKQLGEKFNLMKNSQKSYNEALNSQISKEEHLSYVTSTGANITRELTDEMFNKMRTSGTNEQDIKNLSNNSAELSKELQNYAFSKFGIDKPEMLNKANRQMQNYSNKYENTSYDTDFDNKLKEATK
jgi:hypothetical protein